MLFTGKFGEVYRAQMDIKTTVAIKIVKRYSSQKVMDEFEKEMSIMSQICHNNIVRLYGIITEGIIYGMIDVRIQPSILYILYRSVFSSNGDGVPTLWKPQVFFKRSMYAILWNYNDLLYIPYYSKQRERQPNEFLMKCMNDVAMGMHYLCQSGLIHRVSSQYNDFVNYTVVHAGLGSTQCFSR